MVVLRQPERHARYFELVIETAGLYNTAGFNDDTRAFRSIPARHDLWRRVDANWLAGLVVRGIVDMEDAAEMIQDTAYSLAKKAYKFSRREKRQRQGTGTPSPPVGYRCRCRESAGFLLVAGRRCRIRAAGRGEPEKSRV